MLQTTIEAAKIDVGSCTHFFQLDYIAYGILLTNSWIKMYGSLYVSTSFAL